MYSQSYLLLELLSELEKMENWLYSRSKNSPDNIALEYEGVGYSYKELYKQASAIANWLYINYSTTNRCAIILPNSQHYIFVIHALVMQQIETVLINTRLSPKEIQDQLNRLDVELIIVDPSTKELVQDYAATFLSLDRLEGSIQIIPTYEKYTPKPISLNQIHSFVFTSGTTGTPKIVPLTYKNHFYSAIASSFQLGHDIDDKWLLVIPLYHLGGLAIVFRTCLYGITINLRSNFQEQEISNDLYTGGITIISLVPTMLKRLLPHLEDKPANLRLILLGGEATDPGLVAKSFSSNLPVALTYGMTESSSQFATSLPTNVKDKPQSVGKPLMFNSVKIEHMGLDGIGEIAIKGPTVMSGYFDTSNNEHFTEDGFFLTGDLGYLDDEGDLFVIQRRKDLIISGGENIYPSEIERVLIGFPGIESAVVIGVANQQWGQRPVAVLQLSSPIKSEELSQYMDTHLATYKLPDEYFHLDDFPRTPSGKIIRSEVIRLYLEKKLRSFV